MSLQGLEKKKYDNTVYAKRWREKNPEKSRAASALWRSKNPEKVKLVGKHSKLKKAYGISLDEYRTMLTRQKDCCAICNRVLIEGQGAGAAHVDHCHATGRIRAILCGSCNTLLGRAKDDPAILRRAADYLDRWRSR